MKTQNKNTRTITHLNRGRDYRNEGSRYTFVAAFILFIITLILTFPYQNKAFIETYPSEGEVSSKTVIAPTTFTVPKDSALLAAERRRVRSEVLPVFRYSHTKEDSLLSEWKSMFKGLKRDLSTYTFPRQDTAEQDTGNTVLPPSPHPLLNSREFFALSKYTAKLDTLDYYLRRRMREGIRTTVADTAGSKPHINHLLRRKNNRYITLVSDSTERTVHQDSLHTLPDLYDDIISEISLPEGSDEISFRSALYKIMEHTIAPSISLDTAATRQRLTAALANIDTVKTKVIKNVEIIRKHQRVDEKTEEILSRLKEIEKKGKPETETNLLIRNAASLLLLLIVSFLIFSFIKHFIPTQIASDTYFLLLVLIVSLQLLIIRGSYLFFPMLFFNSHDGFSSFNLVFNGIPMLVSILMVSILFNRENGLLLTLFFAIYLGMTTDFNFISTIKILITGGAASYIANKVRYRRDYLSLVLTLTLINTLVVTLGLVSGYKITPRLFMFASLYAVSDVIFSVIITILILPIIESRFSITTDMKLLELADMSHPLMKRLSIKAPGTYNHSILVANLAESAADEIGANALLCRVAAYYHDIGKVAKDSNYFIENQRTNENPHDYLAPDKSVEIILRHVDDGLCLARKHQLPKIIQSAIAQHHGDSVMQYFYHKALEQTDSRDIIDRGNYTYAGPKPQSAETAIIMLADSIEAASRTFKGETVAELRQLIKGITYAKIEAGQLDECTLTFDEVNQITEGFLRVLLGVFHNRIEY
ncbi:MAG: HD family phosphohydrolase [Fibrobacterota bacterium]